MLPYEIGIVETRNVIKTILDTYGYDFGDYALTSFKRRLENIIITNGLKDAEGLIARLENNKGFFDTFLKDVNPETTKCFAPPLERLGDDILPEIVNSGKPKFGLEPSIRARNYTLFASF